MKKHWSLQYVLHVLSQTGLTATALSEKAGVSSTTLTRPINSPDHTFDISRRTLDKIQVATGIPYALFSGGLSDQAAAALPAATDNHLIPVYGNVAASAGHGSFVDAEVITHTLAFPPDYLRMITSSHPRHLSIIGVKGDSMLPTLAHDDIVMLDSSKTSLAYDGLFVLRFGDALHVKRVTRATNRDKALIVSDNAAHYQPQEYPISEIEVMGKVVWYGKKV